MKLIQPGTVRLKCPNLLIYYINYLAHVLLLYTLTGNILIKTRINILHLL